MPRFGAIRRWSRRQHVAVVFAADRQGLKRFDVEHGPCVAIAGRAKPFIDPLLQDGREGPEQTAALYEVLTGRDPTEALELVDSRGSGRLFKFSSAFVDAMVAASHEIGELIDEDEREGPNVFTRMSAGLTRMDQAWMEAGNWPPQMQSTQNRLPRIHTARVAREKGRDLYVWYGPDAGLAARRPQL